MTTTAALRHQVAEHLAGYRAETRSGAAAADDVAEFARIEKLAASGRMLAAARVADTTAWQGHGHRSPADWLATQAGTSVTDAAGVLSTGRQLRQLPATEDAVRAGNLSTSQARAVTDAATADPTSESTLLDTAARETFKGLRDRADRVKAAATDHAHRERAIHAHRSLRTRTDAQGAHHLHLTGPATDGIHIAALLKPLQEQAFRTARTNGVRPTFENRSYDAFMTLIDRLHPTTGADSNAGTGTRTRTGSAPASAATDDAHTGAPPTTRSLNHADADADADADAGTGTGTGTAANGPDTRNGAPHRGQQRMPGGANTKIIVRIDHTALTRGHAIAGETVEVAGLGPIPVTTVQNLMDDAFLAAVITRGRDVLNVAHLGRTVNAHQRTALEATHLACTNITCNATAGIEIDHRTPWANVAETHLHNQDPLCRPDHHRKTHHHWALEPGTGRRRLLPPDHPDHPTNQDDHPDRRDRRDPPTGHAQAAETPTTRSDPPGDPDARRDPTQQRDPARQGNPTSRDGPTDPSPTTVPGPPDQPAQPALL